MTKYILYEVQTGGSLRRIQETSANSAKDAINQLYRGNRHKVKKTDKRGEIEMVAIAKNNISTFGVDKV